MRGLRGASLLATALAVSACQTSTLYDNSSLASMPSLRGYDSGDAYVRDVIIYLFPRACLYYITSDGVRSSESTSPDKFSFLSIAENAEKDGWYGALLSVTNFRPGGSPIFYFNKNTGDYSCGGNTYLTKKPVEFVTGRYLDLERLSSVKLASTAVEPRTTASPPSGLRRSDKPSSFPTVAEVAKGSNDFRVCGMALKPDNSGWDPGEGVHEYVKEAEKRNLTPATCAKIIAGQ